MTDNTIHPPTEEECWARFWDTMTDVLAGLYRSGWRAEEDQPEVPSAA